MSNYSNQINVVERAVQYSYSNIALYLSTSNSGTLNLSECAYFLRH